MSFTRQDYLAGNCTHDQYYDQYVNLHVKHLVIGCIGRLAIVHSTGHYFNDIPLREWDSLHSLIIGAVGNKKLKELGENNSKSAAVCIAKAAARQIRAAELQAQVQGAKHV